MKRPVVFADTNVLYPHYLSDLLLFLSSDGVIRLLWTQYLVDEVVDVVPRRFLHHGETVREGGSRRLRFPAKSRHPLIVGAWCVCWKDVDYVEP